MKNFFKQIIVAILFFEARLVLKKHKPKIIAITGSVGKTSTKDALFAVMSKFYHVRKSEKSFNSEIGLPLTILGLHNAWNNPLEWIKNIFQGAMVVLSPRKKYPQWLVLEAGVGKPGDMAKIASLIKTDVVVFTEFSAMPVHVEFFKNTDHIFKEKSLIQNTLKKDGLLVLNNDNEKIISLKEYSKHRVASFGFVPSADIYVSNTQISYADNHPTGVTFRINYDGNSLPVVMNGVFGKNHIFAGLVALTIAYELKLNMITAVEALADYEIPPGRMRLIEGEKGTYIIDDTYNSSPLAAETAVMTLKEIRTTGRKIAVLGDMLELGRHTEGAHKHIGALAGEFVDIIMTVGKRAKSIIDGAEEAGMNKENMFYFDDSDGAKEFLEQNIKKGDLILVKGSQGMRMERIVEEIMSHPELAPKLLARQEEEWRNKK
jgi:UDP-N-acetylmuramoyl-tripeptide--D-alanyl-D-alanine ligase